MRRRRDSEEGEEASGAADLGAVADSGAADSAVEGSEAGYPLAGSGGPVSVAVARWLWPVSAAEHS